ncbi:MAG TPA: chorismate lyase [Gammaproteobacteria bacterium]|nr:chorismate lyase [Gammaproteobacteria bacterium]
MGKPEAAPGTPWLAASVWPAGQRQTAPWDWLTHAGSLTQKLRGVAGDGFHVQVLREASALLDAEDAALLELAPGTRARLREVHLCGTRPLVFGRTLAAAHGAARWLDRLGARPLGDRVFGGAGTQRGEIEISRLGAGDALYRDALQGLRAAPEHLWARRSVLDVQGTKLLIYECFLPGVRD